MRKHVNRANMVTITVAERFSTFENLREQYPGTWGLHYCETRELKLKQATCLHGKYESYLF